MLLSFLHTLHPVHRGSDWLCIRNTSTIHFLLTIPMPSSSLRDHSILPVFMLPLLPPCNRFFVNSQSQWLMWFGSQHSSIKNSPELLIFIAQSQSPLHSSTSPTHFLALPEPLLPARQHHSSCSSLSGLLVFSRMYIHPRAFVLTIASAGNT